LLTQEHNEEGHAWPAGEKKRLKFEAFFTRSYRRQTAFCMLCYKPRSISKTVIFHQAEQGGGNMASSHRRENTNHSAPVEARMQRSPLVPPPQVLLTDL